MEEKKRIHKNEYKYIEGIGRSAWLIQTGSLWFVEWISPICSSVLYRYELGREFS